MTGSSASDWAVSKFLKSQPAACSSGSRLSKSSPLTAPIVVSDSPRSQSSCPAAAAQAIGFTPPALVMIFNCDCDANAGTRLCSTSRKSRAYPAVGSFCRCRARIDIVNSARYSSVK